MYCFLVAILEGSIKHLIVSADQNIFIFVFINETRLSQGGVALNDVPCRQFLSFFPTIELEVLIKVLSLPFLNKATSICQKGERNVDWNFPS